MSLSMVHNAGAGWAAGEVLFAADLNTEILNILTNPMSLITPLQLQNLSSAPVSGTTGRIYYNTGLNQVEADDGTFIRAVPTIQTTGFVTGFAVTVNSAGTAFTISPVMTIGTPSLNPFVPLL
jgi:hypothetical protein